MDRSITHEKLGACLHIKIDDQKLNVFTLDLVNTLTHLVDNAIDDLAVQCLIIEGGEKALSVGLDTSVVLSDIPEGKQLLHQTGALLSKLYLSRLRSVVMMQGHATAAGAMILLVADYRIGFGESGKVGLSEVSVGLSVPSQTQQLVRDRIAVPYQYSATALGQLFDHQNAKTAGFLDELAASRDVALKRAREEAARLGNLNEKAYLKTKQMMRRAYSEHD